MTDYEAVFWDIGGVILDHESVQEGHEVFVTELTERFETDLSPAAMLDVFRDELGAYFRETDGNEYRVARTGYRRSVQAILTEDADRVDWEPLFRTIHGTYAESNPWAVETIERLADTPLHLGVISDVDHEEGKRILSDLGVRRYFDAFTSSEEVGRKKPDPAMFETALEKAAVDPERSAMIGDRYSHDMVGGDEFGMTTIAYGAEDGPAVDYVIEDLREVLEIVGIGPIGE